MVESDGVTTVFVETDLAITGKPAQFGRGALADVATTLIDQFAANLADEISTTVQRSAPVPIASATDTEAPSADEPAPDAPTAAPRRSAEPIDLLQATGVGGNRKFVLAVTGLLLALVAFLVLRRRR